MAVLHPMKSVSIIASTALEELLHDLAARHAAPGYTVIDDARGSGATGLQTGALEADTNIIFMMTVETEQLDGLLGDLQCLVDRGYGVAVFVSDTAMLRRQTPPQTATAPTP